MKFFSQALAVLSSSLCLFSTNFLVSPSAHASIVCSSGTISNYQNGSLASCILDQNTTVQVSHPTTGTSHFYCQDKKIISFDDKGQFQTCYLSQEIVIKNDDSIEVCPAGHRVSMSVSTNGIPFISCSPY